MIKINIADMKANLSRYLDRVERGEMIVICRRNIPVAELRPISKLPDKKRPVGIDRGLTIPASFFDPLPADLLDAFEGRDEKT
jgi:prevent-host-death family protein